MSDLLGLVEACSRFLVKAKSSYTMRQERLVQASPRVIAVGNAVVVYVR